MEGAVLIGIAGKEGLWLVDLDKGSVTPYTQPLTGDLATAADWRAKGMKVEKGIDFAVAIPQASSAASGLFEG